MINVPEFVDGKKLNVAVAPDDRLSSMSIVGVFGNENPNDLLPSA